MCLSISNVYEMVVTMAQHINIKSFEDEVWFSEVESNITDFINSMTGKQIKNVNFSNHITNFGLLDEDYCVNGSDTVYFYRTDLEYKLTDDEDDIPLSWCSFEIHLKGNKLQDIFVVA